VNLQMVGCSHHECSIEVRESMAFRPDEVSGALAEFRNRFPNTEAVLLSTCNRTELYTANSEPSDSPRHVEIVDFLADMHGLDGEALFEELFLHRGEEAIRHLFTVASSLHSMVIGEVQILSQVKDAYQQATESKSTGQITHTAFQNAIRVAKRVANETNIHGGRLSIPSVAVNDFAMRIFERLDDKFVLILGAGEMAEETIRYLSEAKASNITVVNRDPSRAEALAAKYGGRSASWEQRAEQLTKADIVVATTGAKEPVVSLGEFQRIEDRRFQKPLFILDLAVPRDFDPAIGNCLGVYLYSIDDLEKVVQSNQILRQKEWPRAKRIIDEETQQFMGELDHRSTGPTIRRLKKNADDIKSAELSRLLHKLDGLDDRSQAEISQSFNRLVNKLLHPPLESLRDEQRSERRRGLLEAVRKLFQLEE